MLPSSGAMQFSTKGPNEVLAASACTIASSTWPSPMPPHSSGMWGSQSPASWAFSRMAKRIWMYSIRASTRSSPPISSSPGFTTSSMNSRTRRRMASSSGVRVKSMLMSLSVGGAGRRGHHRRAATRWRSSGGDQGVGAGEQPERDGVEHVADGLRGLAGARPGVGALEDDAELEAGEDRVPGDGRGVAVAALGVVGDQLVAGGQPAGVAERPGDDVGHGVVGAQRLGPGGEQPAEVEQRVADGAHL